MARLPRVVALDVPHHLTQRGNARQFILSTPEERNVYLQLLQSSAERRELSVLAYCLVASAELWPWSSAAVHCADGPAETWLQLERWRSHWSPSEWRRYLTESEAAGDLAAIRRCTHTGRPLGSPEFVDSLERELQRPLKPRKRGRSPSPPVTEPQEALALTE
jgi:hypothetical protein